MSTEWKPGDAVVATVNGRPNVRLIAGWSKYDPQLRWGELSTRWADGDDDECWFMPYQVTDHRPLVVIDPEDREQAARLIALFSDQFTGWSTDGERDADKMQAALREFANPKPPTCKAAVNLAGEHFGCVEPEGHGGGHRNPDAEAVWGEPE